MSVGHLNRQAFYNAGVLGSGRAQSIEGVAQSDSRRVENLA
jgi:hypothetical protein